MAGLDGRARFAYFSKRRRLVTGVAPGLQNQCQAERSEVGSTPIRFRQKYLKKPHKAAKALWGFSVIRSPFFRMAPSFMKGCFLSACRAFTAFRKRNFFRHFFRIRRNVHARCSCKKSLSSGALSSAPQEKKSGCALKVQLKAFETCPESTLLVAVLLLFYFIRRVSCCAGSFPLRLPFPFFCWC